MVWSMEPVPIEIPSMMDGVCSLPTHISKLDDLEDTTYRV